MTAVSSNLLAADVRRGMTLKVAGAWRKVARVTVFVDKVAVSFANGDSIRWAFDQPLVARLTDST